MIHSDKVGTKSGILGFFYCAILLKCGTMFNFTCFIFYLSLKKTMKKAYFDDQIFQSIDYATVPLTKGEYENCTFTDCIFANSDVSEIIFVDCTFEQCDWTMAKLHDTSFRSIK